MTRTFPFRAALSRSGAWAPILVLALMVLLAVPLTPPNARPASSPGGSVPASRTEIPVADGVLTGTIGTLQITLHNTMAKATGPYQQLLRINSSAYSAFINSNWSNARPYYTSNGTPIYGWLESNATNRSTDTLLWLNLSSIPSDSFTNVSIGFWPKSSFNLSATGYLGEAPQLSSTYGAFDNGAKVFNFYDDFSGSALATQWKVGGSWTYTVHDGVNVTVAAGSGQGIYSRQTFDYPTVVDFYGNLFQSVTTGVYLGEGMGTSICTGCGTGDFVGYSSEGSTAGPRPATADGTGNSGGTAVYSTQQFGVFTTEAVSTSEADFELNYSSSQTLSAPIPVGAQPVGLALAAAPSGALTNTETTYWIRERAYVAQMPVVTAVAVPYRVNFTESGLPTGTGWWVNVSGGPTTFSRNATLEVPEVDGTYTYSIATTNKTYRAPPGSFTVNGPPSEVLVTFSLVTFAVQFNETGLPNGTSWVLAIRGQPLRLATGDNLSFNQTNGTYSYSATANDPNYLSNPGTFEVVGSLTQVPIVFLRVTYSVTFIESGLPAGSGWSLSVDGGPMVPATGPNVTVNESNGTHTYAVASKNRSFAAPGGTFTIAGLGPTLDVAFSLVTYPVTFNETGLPAGTNWWITLSGTPTTRSDSGSLVAPLPNGTYTFSASRPDSTYLAPSGTLSVDGAPVSQAVEYVRVTYPTIFTESGLPTGSTWSVTLNGRTETGTGNLEFSGLPNGTYDFEVPALSGFTASPAHGSVKVSGSAVAQSITFVRPAKTFLGLPPSEGYAVLGGIIAAIAVGGVGVGFWFFRKRRIPPARKPPSRAPPPRRPASGPIASRSPGRIAPPPPRR